MPPKVIKRPPLPPRAIRPLNYHQIVIEMMRFLEVAIHTILCVRRVYPLGLFKRVKKYDAPVYQSQHPDLNKYISGAVKAVGDEIIRATVERVVLVIRDRDNIAIERLLFNFSGFVVTDENDQWQKWMNLENVMNKTTLFRYFRSFLIRIALLDGALGVLPESWDPTFAVVLEMKDGEIPADPITKPKAKNKPPINWVPAVHQNTTAGTTAEAENHVIRAVNTGLINLTLIVQESEEKIEKLKEMEEAMEA